MLYRATENSIVNLDLVVNIRLDTDRKCVYFCFSNGQADKVMFGSADDATEYFNGVTNELQGELMLIGE